MMNIGPGHSARTSKRRGCRCHLAFFSGNEIFWKTRWEPSIDGSNTANRTLVCYKETHANAGLIRDASPMDVDGHWRDPRLASHDAPMGRPRML
jgi:hypothetical protein